MEVPIFDPMKLKAKDIYLRIKAKVNLPIGLRLYSPPVMAASIKVIGLRPFNIKIPLFSSEVQK